MVQHKLEEARAQLFHREVELRQLRDQLASKSAEQVAPSPASSPDDLIDLNDERVLQDVGIYRYHHPLENAPAFRDQLDALQTQIKGMVKAGDAVLASDMFTYNNS